MPGFFFWVNVQKEIRRPRRWTAHFISIHFFHLIRLWCYGYGYGEPEDLIFCALYYMFLAWLFFFFFFNIRLHFIGCMGCFSGLSFEALPSPSPVSGLTSFWQEIRMARLWARLRDDLFILKYSPFKWLHNAWGHSKKQVPLVRDLMFSQRLFNYIVLLHFNPAFSLLDTALGQGVLLSL